MQTKFPYLNGLLKRKNLKSMVLQTEPASSSKQQYRKLGVKPFHLKTDMSNADDDELDEHYQGSI